MPASQEERTPSMPERYRMGSAMHDPHALVRRDPLTPLAFLERTVRVFPEKTAVVYGERRQSWAEFAQDVGRFAGALRRAGVEPGDRVALLAPNVPSLLAAHFAVLLVRGALVAINTRLNASEVGYILDHSGAKVVIADPELAPRVAEAPGGLAARPLLVNLEDPVAGVVEHVLDGPGFEEFLDGAPVLPISGGIDDEDRITSINYTSGTTGRPKGVMYTHRGAYLNALGEVMVHGLERDSVYLWTLPLFHCNGWCFPWAVTAAGGTHVMLRAIDPARVIGLIQAERVTHFNGAPTVLLMIAEAPEAKGVHFDPPIRVATGGAPPSPTLLARMEELGRPRQPYLRPDRDLRSARLLRAPARLGTARRRAARRGDGAPGRPVPGCDPPARRRRRDARRSRRRTDDGRGRDAREQRDGGVLRRPGSHREGVRGRLVPLRRPRGDAPGRLPRAARPQEGHHHQRRREHLDDRGRARDREAPRGARVRGRRGAATRSGARCRRRSCRCARASRSANRS